MEEIGAVLDVNSGVDINKSDRKITINWYPGTGYPKNTNFNIDDIGDYLINVSTRLTDPAMSPVLSTTEYFKELWFNKVGVEISAGTEQSGDGYDSILLSGEGSVQMLSGTNWIGHIPFTIDKNSPFNFTLPTIQNANIYRMSLPSALIMGTNSSTKYTLESIGINALGNNNNITPVTTLVANIFEKKRSVDVEQTVAVVDHLTNSKKITAAFSNISVEQIDSKLSMNDDATKIKIYKAFGKISTIINGINELILTQPLELNSTTSQVIFCITEELYNKEPVEILSDETFYTRIVCCTIAKLNNLTVDTLSIVQRNLCTNIGIIIKKIIDLIETENTVSTIQNNISAIQSGLTNAIVLDSKLSDIISSSILSTEQLDNIMDSIKNISKECIINKGGIITEKFVNNTLNTISQYALDQSNNSTEWELCNSEIEFLKNSIEKLSNNLTFAINELGSLTRNSDDKKYDVYYNKYITKLKDNTWRSYQSHRRLLQAIEDNNLSDAAYVNSYLSTGHNIDNIIPEF